MADANIFYSIVVPFHNEELSVIELLSQITNVMKDLKEPYEVIAVDDRSTDTTREKLSQFAASDPAIVNVFLPLRTGQTGALAAGFSRVRGAITISMDGDLQDDPSNIPSLLKKLRESGADVVCGWRWKRDDSALVIIYSKIGNFFQRLFLGTSIHDISCTFRAYKTSALNTVNMKAAGLHRFLPFLLKRRGFSLAEEKIMQHPRRHGVSKYSSKKALETISLFFGIVSGRY
ncbi:MAG: glycosyltransferase family 2 protein [Candidatus Omnitrophica bacterium]|nr:glycosyltransferase family 2 protein [Candidatus Omnitrophota bacterium]